MNRKANPSRWADLFGRGDLTASFVAIFPLVVCYQISVRFGAPVNGADFISGALLRLCNGSTLAYVGIHGALVVWFVVWIRRGNRTSTLRFAVLGPLLAESAVYGLGLGALLSLLVHRGLGLSLSGSEIMAAIGAGVHEEVLFRLILMTLVLGLARLVTVRPLALPLSCFVSALAFSLAHHVGAHGEPFVVATAVYRCLAGIAFALIYWNRSLAHAVYAHIIYDVAVFGLR
jgi:hypothetical protein